MLVYTSITKSYLPKARVLAKSVKRFHPNWYFVLLFSDSLPKDFDLDSEPFDELLMIEDLVIPNWKSWAFGHNVVELCTAVKGPAAEFLAKRPSVDKIMYLDPDIRLFNSLAYLENLLNQYDILLTPHLLDMEQDLESIKDNEISALKHGIYNLGFFAAKTSGQGLDFICWWSKRLRHFCCDDIPSGLFTDQRWCDLAPAFFDRLFIVRDRGYNVATWNIGHRPISCNNDGIIYAAGVPLRFYHFTGYDSGDGMGMLRRYAPVESFAHNLWRDYGKSLIAEGNGSPIYQGWKYGEFDNGIKINSDMRKIYQSRLDLQVAFPDPFNSKKFSFFDWWNFEYIAHNQLKENDSNFGLPFNKKHLASKFITLHGLYQFIKKLWRCFIQKVSQ